MTLHTKALDVACPTCGAEPGERCSWWYANNTRVIMRDDPHQSRISAAARQTREANRRGRNG